MKTLFEKSQKAFKIKMHCHMKSRLQNRCPFCGIAVSAGYTPSIRHLISRNLSKWSVHSIKKVLTTNTICNTTKAFEMCKAKDFNLSYKCLTGFALRQALRDLPQTDPAFQLELLSAKSASELVEKIMEDEIILEDNEDLPEVFDDESSLSVDAVLTKIMGQTATGTPTESIVQDEIVIRDENGNFVSQFGELESSVEQPSLEFQDEELGRGKRFRKPSGRFADKRFWEEH
jgi:hypothetical protein